MSVSPSDDLEYTGVGPLSLAVFEMVAIFFVVMWASGGGVTSGGALGAVIVLTAFALLPVSVIGGIWAANSIANAAPPTNRVPAWVAVALHIALCVPGLVVFFMGGLS
ncbi:hypothetical protein [Paraburkholderia bannensis]|uniref:hypothetical protein n=1 Tax=Paraburkholderia bannensis TaxID=765414 RepID=UPI002AB7C2A8|nr:hypothetical protein [Paraburkholderia bannensis]